MEAEAETKVVDGRSKPSRTASPSTDGLPRDRLVGRYELLHRLGHGGMATVYLGRAVGTAGFEKMVAVKVIHPHLANEPDFVEMFLDEARIAARIRHPHVVEILDLGREDDVFFMVMEYIEGDTLSTLLRELRKTGERISVAVVLQILADACEGLAAAHDLVDPDGVPYHLVHRDVSPHNLLVGLDGRVCVVDFGIMKAAGKRSTTLTGQLRGKLPYMSPEQARGQSIDRRTDVFALGAVAWELLTNERLIAGETESEILARVSDFELPDIRELREVPDGMRRILERALAAERDGRYADTHEMLRDIRQAQRAMTDVLDARGDLSALVKRHFEPRIEYVRASARARGIDRSGERRRRSSSVELADAARSASTSAEVLRTPTAVIQPSGGAASSSGAAANSGIASGSGVIARGTGRDFPEVPTQLTSVPPTSGARGGRSWGLLIGLPLVGAAFGTAIVTYAQRDSPARAPTTVVSDPEPAASPPSSDRAGGSGGIEAPDFVTWVFNTEPQGATVTIAGRRYDRVTPMAVEMPYGTSPVAVRLERDGFESYEAQLAPIKPDNHTHRFVAKDEPKPTRPLTNTTIRYTIKKPKPKPPVDTSPGTPTTAPPPVESHADGPKLADMPDLTGTKPRPPGG